MKPTRCLSCQLVHNSLTRHCPELGFLLQAVCAVREGRRGPSDVVWGSAHDLAPPYPGKCVMGAVGGAEGRGTRGCWPQGLSVCARAAGASLNNVSLLAVNIQYGGHVFCSLTSVPLPYHSCYEMQRQSLVPAWLHCFDLLPPLAPPASPVVTGARPILRFTQALVLGPDSVDSSTQVGGMQGSTNTVLN
jgi:hypothetical protein